MGAARRVVAAAALAAKEYALRLPQEVAEAKLFIQQARFDLPALPAAVRPAADSGLRNLAGLLDRLAPPDSVALAADALIRRIGTEEPLPSRFTRPSFSASLRSTRSWTSRMARRTACAR